MSGCMTWRQAAECVREIGAEHRRQRELERTRCREDRVAAALAILQDDEILAAADDIRRRREVAP